MEIVWFLASGLIMGLLALVYFVYQIKKGGFQRLEETKYHVFHEEEDA